MRDVEFHVRIPVPVIRYLEQNDYTHFASPTYAKSYLKQYADYLGVDANYWLDNFDTSNAVSHLDAFSQFEGVASTHTETSAKPQKAVRKQHSRTLSESTPHNNTFSAVLATLVCAAVIGGGYSLYKFFENQVDEPELVIEQKEEAEAEPPVAETPEKAVVAEPAQPAPVVVSTPSPSPSPVLLPPVAEVIDEEALFAELLGAPAEETREEDDSYVEPDENEALTSGSQNSIVLPSE